MNLRHIQRTFCQAMEQREAEPRLLSYVLEQGHLSSQQRLAIYRNNKDSNLLKILRSHYPVCRQLVGDAFFVSMAQAYSIQTPSDSPDLNNYGRTFPRFIRDFPSAQCLPYLSDVAKLEWDWLQVFYGADTVTTLNVERIMDADQAARIVFQLQENTILLTSPYPIDRIWQVNQPDYSDEPAVELNEGKVYLIVWRKQWQVRINRLTRLEWRLLQAFVSGLSLEAVCEQAIAQTIDVTNYLPKFIAHGWLTRV